jgi:hypothetical protein
MLKGRSAVATRNIEIEKCNGNRQKLNIKKAKCN